MEPPSGSASRWHVPWSRLLLAVSLSTFWTPPTTAQLAVKTLPLLAAEGSHVLLAHNISENPLGYAWYRGESVDNTQLIASYRVATNATTNGAVYSRRETLYPNGTLLIQNVTQKDTGSYTLLVTKKDLQTERLTGHLCIYTLLPTPVITSNNSNPRQHEDTVVLTCRFETCDVFYMCSVNNQSLPNSMELELCKGNRTLTVFNVKRHDTGPCVREAGDPENVTHDDPSTQNGLRPVARMTSESTGLQQPPWDMVPLAALSPRPPYPAPSQLFPSMRNYSIPTQISTARSTPK
ncbi:PREDICTED: carcinoembryonic antigen-related cell adhesion molecule 6-like isoform X2 [Capra hircus]|uniref:carcinoembryonic antigen-related cell adhesion molecule 6-like isoform X2 n=1 Tax=Capra hircus TaxID=9925 RepID=UPI00084710AB|nr:PREDICTED: carcinoembryonic antigen-related cell adhesion molecule 6-like isoform X2 [Capra hircus]